MGRYKNIMNVTSASENIPQVGKIKDRESDIYLQFNSADRLDLLSYRVYGDPQYWWLILAANDYQIEFDIEDGEILRIPYPLSDAINEIRARV